MTWLIIGIALILCALAYLFIYGADSRKKNDYFRRVEDDEQEKALSELRMKKDNSSTNKK